MDRLISEDQGGYLTLTLANGENAERGKLACVDLGNNGAIVAGKADTDLFSIGIFNESFVGDGSRKIHIKLHREFQGSWWDNDTVNAVTANDRGKWVYIKDAETVSILGTGRSPAGISLDVSPSDGVFVVFSFPPVPPPVAE